MYANTYAGHTPYPDVHLGPSCEAIISYLKDGNRMEKPESCSDELLVCADVFSFVYSTYFPAMN